jgi:hypothetical protein
MGIFAEPANSNGVGRNAFEDGLVGVASIEGDHERTLCGGRISDDGGT